MNPSDKPASIEVTFMEPDGTSTVRKYAVAPRSRHTVSLGSVLPSSEASTRVKADIPVVTERAVYFSERSGGTVSPGVRGY
jgi:hypothetical protein